MCTREKINKHARRNFVEMFFYFLTSQPVTSLYGAHKGTLSVVIYFISFVRNNISFVRNFISFVRNIILFVRNDFVCTKYYFVCTK